MTTRDPTYPQIVIDHLPKIEALCQRPRALRKVRLSVVERAPDCQDQAAEVLEVCPTLCWREMDSNHRSLSRGSRFILRRWIGGIDGGSQKNSAGYRWFESISLQRRESRAISPLRFFYSHARTRVRVKKSEVKYLTWTDDNLLRQVVYEGLRVEASEARLQSVPRMFICLELLAAETSESCVRYTNRATVEPCSRD